MNGLPRARYLYCSETWRLRETRAGDLRTGLVASVDAKRRYRWAVTAFMDGYITAGLFLDEATRFDAAVEDTRLTETRLYSHLEQVKRRVRTSAREGFVDREGWTWIVNEMARQERAERETRWRNETALQRQALRQGHRTLTEIRRRLREADRSPLPESAPGRTSRAS